MTTGHIVCVSVMPKMHKIPLPIDACGASFSAPTANHLELYGKLAQLTGGLSISNLRNASHSPIGQAFRYLFIANVSKQHM